MVKFVASIMTVWLCLGSALYGAVKVSVDLESSTYSADDRITGTLTISHSKGEKVDPDSFVMADKQLPVQFLQDIKISPDVIASLYRFSLPPQDPGLHTLPEINVKVNAKKYSSVATTFVVRTGSNNQGTSTAASPIPTPSSPSSTAQDSDIVLKLEAVVDGPTTLFPGQKTKLVYRYFFSGNIELNQETLPLMAAEGFKKIGQQEIKDAQTAHLGVRQVIQEVEAVNPGTFVLGPSIIAGRAYQQDAQGKRIYIGTPLKAEAPAITLTVKPFGAKDKPTGFSGAVGDFTALTTHVLSPTDVVIGDAVTISIALEGKGDLASAKLPDLCCLPGFSGRFRVSDIPAMEEIDGNTKYFVTQLKPLSTSIKEIPPIPFSYFNSTTGQYSSLKSAPVAINVKMDPLGVTEAPDYQGEQVEWPTEPQKPKTAQATKPVEEVAQEGSDANWWYYLLLPLGALAVWVLLRDRKTPVQSQSQPSVGTGQTTADSNQLITQAYQAQKDPSRFYYLISKALFKTLEENGEILNADTTVETLPEYGLPGEVKAFLNTINEQRFSGNATASQPAQVLQEAALLRKKIQHSGKSQGNQPPNPS